MPMESRAGYTAVADYAPGHVVEGAFAERFKELGGDDGLDRTETHSTPSTSLRLPSVSREPIRIILDIFIPSGAPAVGYIKALADRGLMNKVAVSWSWGKRKTKDLHLYDDSVINFNQVLYYTSGLDNAENVNLKRKIAELFGPDALPSIYTVGAYDGMRVGVQDARCPLPTANWTATQR